MQTPAAAFYNNPTRLGVERDEVFARSWQVVGHIGQLPRHGDYFTAKIGNEPLVFVNDNGTIPSEDYFTQGDSGSALVGDYFRGDGSSSYEVFAIYNYDWAEGLNGGTMELLAGFESIPSVRAQLVGAAQSAL